MIAKVSYDSLWQQLLCFYQSVQGDRCEDICIASLKLQGKVQKGQGQKF